ncbi:MAG: PHP domain-containing protein [Planctomycetota bacterium]
MIDYDLHIHTEYCGHATGMTVAAILERAEAMGLSSVAITDHIFSHDDHAVIQKIRADVAAYGPALKVYVGAEVDVDYEHTDGRFVTDTFEGLDLVIAGFHYVPTVGNYPRSPQDNTLNADEFLQHWHDSLLGIVSNPNVDILAHPGRLLAAGVDLEVHFEDALCIFAEAAALSAQNNIAWEINEMTGCRLSPQWWGQWHRIYETALAEGVKLVYGSDAHTPEAIGTHEYVDRILAKLPKNCLARPEEILTLKKKNK